jgi:cell division protein ZapA
LNTKINELKLINIKLPSSIQTLVDLTEKNKLIELKKENEEYKNLLSLKDKEISRLNDLNKSNQNEKIQMKKKQLNIDSGNNDLKDSSVNEKESKIELKVYNINEEKPKKVKKKKIKSNNNGEVNKEENENGIPNNKINYEKEINNLKQIISKNKSKIKEYEDNIFNANNEIKQKAKSISDFEKIILKQEDKIEKLNDQISELNKSVFSKDLLMKKNENYSLQLITIIKEQKLQIQNIKDKRIDEDNDEITMLKREIENLKNELEVKQNLIISMKENHKSLQDKYLSFCYNVRKKEQEDLLNKAKLLQKHKMEKDYISSRLKSHSMSKNSSISAFSIKSLNGINKINLKNKWNKKNEEISLPSIINNFKSDDDIKSEMKNNERKNLDDINNMMKQIIEEN